MSIPTSLFNSKFIYKSSDYVHMYICVSVICLHMNDNYIIKVNVNELKFNHKHLIYMYFMATYIIIMIVYV